MDMANWLNHIEKRGGKQNIVQFIFDNSRFHYVKPDVPIEEQFEVDEEDDVWIFYNKEQPFTINGKRVPDIHVEANEGLQSVIFVEKVEDKRYYRGDV